jgi:hypothetical protein
VKFLELLPVDRVTKALSKAKALADLEAEYERRRAELLA